MLQQVRAREPGVDEVLHEHDVATAEVELDVLHDAHAAGVGRVARDREEVDEHVDVLDRARTRSARKTSAPFSTPTSTTPSGWSSSIGRAEAFDDRRELGAIEDDSAPSAGSLAQRVVDRARAATRRAARALR